MFYARFLELCEKANLSPSAAAVKAGFNKGTVSVWKRKYEEGKDVDPDQETINKICAFFGCTENWLRGMFDWEVPTVFDDEDELSDEELKFIEWFRTKASAKDKALIRMIVEGDK